MCGHNHDKPITIFRGDDTDAFGLRTITIKLTGDLDLTTAKAKFVLLGYAKEWNEIPASGELTMVMTAAQTKQLPLGLAMGTLTLLDGTKNLTVCNTIPFFITNRVDEKQIDEFRIDVKLAVDTEVNIEFKVEGPKGDPGEAATIEVGTVRTVASDEPAAVRNVGTPNAAVFDFDIPRGESGFSEWEVDGNRLKPTIEGVTGLALPALANTSSIGGKYTLADVKNLCNALLNALKG